MHTKTPTLKDAPFILEQLTKYQEEARESQDSRTAGLLAAEAGVASNLMLFVVLHNIANSLERLATVTESKN